MFAIGTKRTSKTKVGNSVIRASARLASESLLAKARDFDGGMAQASSEGSRDRALKIRRSCYVNFATVHRSITPMP